MFILRVDITFVVTTNFSNELIDCKIEKSRVSRHSVSCSQLMRLKNLSCDKCNIGLTH